MSRPAREVALRDRRLVQTAVIGGAGSQSPALLPMQAAQARAFRQAHVGQTFWCGQWLGGCRGRLTIRTPKQRVAHFVHVAGPERAACRRRLVGVSGADHLYIKQQILAWLDSQGIAAAALLPEDLERAGSEVLFDPGERGCLRVLLDADAAPTAPDENTQLLLGPGVGHDPRQLTVHGYVLRIRCDTDGPLRRVMIGTQLHERTEWVPLEVCRLMPWGLSTPEAEEVRRLRTRTAIDFPHRVPAPTSPAAARPVAAPQGADDRQSAFDSLRRAVEDERSTSEVRHRLTRVERAVHGGASAEEDTLLRAGADLLLRRERGVGASAPPASAARPRRGRSGSSAAGRAVEAVGDLLNTLQRRRGRMRAEEMQQLVARLQDQAQTAGPWLTRDQRRQIKAWGKRSRSANPPAAAPKAAAAPVPVPRAAAAPAPAAVSEPAPRARPRRATRAGPRRAPGAPAASAEVGAVADTVRDVLEHIACLGATITWDQLCAQVKGLAELNGEQQHQALNAASARSRCMRQLTALITTSGVAHPHYRQLAGTGEGPAARTAWQHALADVHAAYRPTPPSPGARPHGAAP
ncbi:competence protein CoiA family protein [Streptomyces sp. NPDC047070]|uniref:competence protein CoiA family protein n=1 Tax=Streptomyces sp. NPDC047070 TaxID=3154923 RepID=UPI0034565C31